MSRRKGRAGETLPEKFARIGCTVTAAGCHEWNGGKYATGYGAVQLGSRSTGDMRMGYAHRAAWELANGPIPEGMFVCHRCDNPPCCNVEHLFLGTVDENNLDMRRKGRHARGETNGHARLTDEQVAEIRAARAAGEAPKSIAKRYGVTRGYVYALCSQRNRKSAA